MKTEKISEFTQVVIDLSMLCARCLDVDHYKDDIGIPVRGKEGISNVLRSGLKFIESLSTTDENIDEVKQSMKEWLNYFQKNYLPKKKILSLKSFYLESEDAEKFTEDIDWWVNSIENYFSKPKYALIKEIDFDKFLPLSITKKLNKGVLQDLKSGFTLLGSESPTASTMILLRAAEGAVKNYYLQVIGQQTTKLNWNAIIDELEKNHHIKKPFANYLHYLRDKRNEAAHPGKQFEQEESERIIIQVKGLLEVISKHNS